MFKFALILSIFIHLFMLIKTNIKTLPTSKNYREEHQKKIKISLIKDVAFSSKKLSQEQKSLSSFKDLRFSKDYFNENIKKYDPSQIEKLDPGGIKRNCFEDILSSSIRFPDIVFQNQITGKAGVSVTVRTNSIELKLIKSTHAILSQLLCFYLKEQFEKVSNTDCLKQSEIQGRYTLNATYSYGHENHRLNHRSGRNYNYSLQRIKKTSPLRVLMAISNIFTLLEIYQSTGDKAIDKVFLLNLQKFNCDQLKVYL